MEQRAAILLSMPTEQILGRYWWQIVHPADEQTVHESFMHAIQVIAVLLDLFKFYLVTMMIFSRDSNMKVFKPL